MPTCSDIFADKKAPPPSTKKVVVPPPKKVYTNEEERETALFEGLAAYVCVGSARSFSAVAKLSV